MSELKGPNFFLIGTAKAGTTSLSSLLAMHPQAAIAEGKEPHFFSVDERYALGWKAYLTVYRRAQGHAAIGDASTSYSRIRQYPRCVERIKAHVPDAKIILMVRHPLRRMESAYVEFTCKPGRIVHASINEAIEQEPMILDSGRYWEIYDAYRCSFGEANVKVVWFEDYAKDTLTTFQQVCRFLEIDHNFEPDLGAQRANSRDDAASRLRARGADIAQLDLRWRADIREHVLAQLADDNRKLLRHFGRDGGQWEGLFQSVSVDQ